MKTISAIIEKGAYQCLNLFFKFKMASLIIFMWMCIICTIFTFNVFTGGLAFFIYFYVKREKSKRGLVAIHKTS